MNFLRAIFTAPLRALAALALIHTANRTWVTERLAQRPGGYLLKGVIALTLGAWLVISLTATEEQRNSLNQTLQVFWSQIRK